MGNCSLNRKFSLFCACILAACFSAFAAEEISDVEPPLPVVKIPSRVQSLDWNADGSMFAHTEGNTITVRNGKSFGKVHDVGINGGQIHDLKFADNFKGYLEQLIMFSENSELSVFKLPEASPTIIERLGIIPPPTIEFSHDGNFIAVARQDGNVDIFFQLYLTQNITKSMLKNPLTENSYGNTISAFAFSKEEKLLAALQTDGKIVVWSMSTRKPVAQLSTSGKTITPCILFDNSNSVITAVDGRKIQVRNLNGKTLLEFKTEKDIVSFALSDGGDNLIVLTKDNRFYFYSLKDGSNMGFIPAWNSTEVSCYSMSKDGRRLLVGHDDGSIYILEINRVFLPKGSKPGVYSMYDVDTGEQWQYDAGRLVRLSKDDAVVKKTAHNIEIRSGYRFSTAEYFKHGINLQVGYINDRLVRKFYFGGMFDGSFFFPTDDYPYRYRIGGKLIHDNPYFCVVDFDLVAGKFWEPIKTNPDFTLFVETILGGGCRFLVNRVLGTGDPSLGFYGGINGGLRWKGLTVYAGGGFDTVMNGVFGAGVGYRIRFSPEKKSTKQGTKKEKKSKNK